MKPEVIGFIFARGGSKGVPGKNIRSLGGKPLLAYAIESARGSRYISRVIVSTDDEKIASVARQFGAEVPFMRPAELATDDSPELLSWKHALIEVKKETSRLPDVFVCIPATSPFRSSSDIDACVKEILESDADLIITIKTADRSPYFNMVTLDRDGYAHIVIPTNPEISRRQGCPVVYDMTTVAFVARPDYILKATRLQEGKVRSVEIPPDRALDIDTELDFQIGECLMKILRRNQQG